MATCSIGLLILEHEGSYTSKEKSIKTIKCCCKPQMVCSVATRFVGTFGSTFSGFVHRLRGHHHPSLVPDKVLSTINLQPHC